MTQIICFDVHVHVGIFPSRLHLYTYVLMYRESNVEGGEVIASIIILSHDIAPKVQTLDSYLIL